MFNLFKKKYSIKITHRQSTVLFTALKQLENSAERYKIDKDVKYLKRKMIEFNK